MNSTRPQIYLTIPSRYFFHWLLHLNRKLLVTRSALTFFGFERRGM